MLAPDTDPAALAGLEIVDRRGERLGRIRQVYPGGGAVGWAGVRGNLIGTTEALIPLDDADLEDDVVQVPVTRARFLSAPRRTPNAPLTDEEREALTRFYDSPPPPSTVAVVTPEPDAADDPDGDVAPDEVVRSESRLVVSTEPVPRTRVVLRKVVVTEQRTVTVPVRREEVRLVREPIVDGAAVEGDVIGESEVELVLHEERVVVTTEVVPVERIRLVREVVVEQREVVGEVWREQVDAGPLAAAAGAAAPPAATAPMSSTTATAEPATAPPTAEDASSDDDATPSATAPSGPAEPESATADSGSAPSEQEAAPAQDAEGGASATSDEQTEPAATHDGDAGDTAPSSDAASAPSDAEQPAQHHRTRTRKPRPPASDAS